jgi:hypothetical protein
VVLGALLAAPVFRTADAAVVLALDLADLVERADAVVVAAPLRKESRWDDKGRIVTDVTLFVEEDLKGAPEAGTEIVVTTLGGTIGDIGLLVAGAPRFRDGGSAIVFLREIPAYGELRVVGMSQGVLPIIEDESGSVVIPDNEGLALLRQDDDGMEAHLRRSPIAPTPLRRMVAEIRRLVGGARAR